MMRKSAFACALLLPGMGFVSGFGARAQQQTVTINDATEVQAYNSAVTQADAKARAAALEEYLRNYPKSVVKKSVLEQLEDIYQGLSDEAMAKAQSGDKAAQAKAMQEAIGSSDKELAAAAELLELDPGDLKATFLSVVIRKQKGQRGNDLKTLDDAARQAREGLNLKKPAIMPDADWNKLTSAAFPVFHSAIAFDAGKNNDFRTAVDEYRAALSEYPSDATSSGPALLDTYRIAQAYMQPGVKDPVKAIWFFARAWRFAPAQYRPEIEVELEQAYNDYHGGLDGLNEVKDQTAASLFPPDSFSVKPAPSRADQIHTFLAQIPDSSKLSMQDIETVLAAGYKEDAGRVWDMLKDQSTPVPGTVIAATSSLFKVAVTEAGPAPGQTKTKEFLVGLRTPLGCEEAQPPGIDLKGIEDFILAKGAKQDIEQLARLFRDNPGKIRKVVLDPAASSVEVAVTKDAKTAKAPDFIVNLKTPISCKTVSRKEFGMQPAIELDGTYDSYRQVAATGATAQSVQIVLRDGFVQPEKRKPVSRKPAGGERKTTHT